MRAKQLCGYVLTVTDKSPKKFRFTLVARLQNYSLDVVESLYKANLVHVRVGDEPGREERSCLQREAYVGLRTLDYLALIAREQGCLLPKQYEQISIQGAEIMRLLIAWAKSDRKRYEGWG